jgi:hypothetical protein
MDALAGDVAERGVHQALALKARDTGEGSAFDIDGEMRFAGSVIAHVTRVTGGIVDDVKISGGEGGFEKLPHFLCDRSVHGLPFRRSIPHLEAGETF